MTDLERAIQAVEGGLLEPRNEVDTPRDKMALSDRMEHYDVPGVSIALIDQGEISWAKVYGLVEARKEEEVTTETIFQAGSIAKTVTTLVALQLVEAGSLDLEADVNDALRSWKVPESKHTRMRRDGTQPVVTLRGILSHSSGLGTPTYRGYVLGRELPTLHQILNGEPPANSRPVKSVQKPGKFKYSGGGFLVAQQLIEDVTGRRLTDLAQELVFKRLGMSNTVLYHELPEALLPQAATGHNRVGKSVPGRWHRYREHAAGGLWSTPSDLACLVVEMLKSYDGESNLVVSKEMTRQMVTPHAGIAGLGCFLTMTNGDPRFGHTGWTEGFHSLMVGVSGQGFIIVTNGENGGKLMWEVMRGVDEVFGWRW